MLRKWVVCVIVWLLSAGMLQASTVTTLKSTADTFVLNPGSGKTSANASANYNYGSSGSLSVASATASQEKGEFETLLKYDCSSLTGQTITGLSLTVSLLNGNSAAGGIFNYPGSAGNFDIFWITSDWVEGTGEPMSKVTSGITYNGLQTLLESSPATYLDTFYYGDYDGDGTNDSGTHSFVIDLTNSNYSGLLNAISSGETISFMLAASDGSDVAFNITAKNGEILTFTSIPEPATLVLLLSGAILLKRRRD